MSIKNDFMIQRTNDDRAQINVLSDKMDEIYREVVKIKEANAGYISSSVYAPYISKARNICSDLQEFYDTYMNDRILYRKGSNAYIQAINEAADKSVNNIHIIKSGILTNNGQAISNTPEITISNNSSGYYGSPNKLAVKCTIARSDSSSVSEIVKTKGSFPEIYPGNIKIISLTKPTFSGAGGTYTKMVTEILKYYDDDSGYDVIASYLESCNLTF